ncbi:MAG: hypothetical protein CVT89_06355, partial [Candidatus Altiarchaeales archaeon HGW-Altiarchaeales-2]
YVVKNIGNINLANINVADDKCLNITCPKNALAAEDSMICNCTIYISQTTTNIASVSTKSYDKTTSKSDFAYVKVIHPNLSIGTTPNTTQIYYGENLTYYYNITNKGDVHLTNINVSDNKCSNVACPKTTLDVNESVVCNCTTTSSICGNLINIANVTVKDSLNVPITATSNAGVFVACPNISISKTANPTSLPAGGGNVTCYYNVTNTGNLNLTNINVSDDKCSNVSCPNVTLASSQNMICNCTALIYRTTTNIASVTALTSFNITVFANTSLTVNVVVPASQDSSSSSSASSGGGTPQNQTANITQNISQENVSEGNGKTGQRISGGASENVTNISKEREGCVNCGAYYQSWLKDGLIETKKKEDAGKAERENAISPNGKSENISLPLQKGENATNISSKPSLPYSDKTEHDRLDKGALWWLWLIPLILLLLLLYLLLIKKKILLDHYVL